MANHASITLVGHIAEPKYSGEGDAIVARFGLAVTRKRKTGDVTTWWNCTCWRQDAKFLNQYGGKGTLVLVEGEPYEDEFEGKKYLKVDVRRVVVLSGQNALKQEASAPQPKEPQKPSNSGGGSGLDEPPFHRYLGADFN